MGTCATGALFQLAAIPGGNNNTAMFLHQRAVYRDSNGACCFLGVLKALSLLFLALSLALSLLLLLL